MHDEHYYPAGCSVSEKLVGMSRRSFLKTAGAAASLACAGSLGPLSYGEALAEAGSAGEEVIPTWCGMCGPANNCAIYAFRNNGVFTRVAGMKEAPHNKGALCCKAHAAPQFVNSPDRLLYPMKRAGKRGEGKFRRITWDEALRSVVGKLTEQKQKYGPESLAVLSPAKRDYSDYLYRFLIAHGSPNYAHSGICAIQLFFGFNYTLGARPGPDYRNADVILIWGKQPVYSGPPLGTPVALVNARERRAKIYAIKPSLEPDGSFADVWAPVRPGTDAALALGMLHVITAEGLIDREFVDKWCYGYPELVEHVKKYSPAWAETVTGVPAGQIVEMSRTYATTKKAAIDFGNGLEHAASSSDAIRAIAILIAITGHLDRPGCNLAPAPASVMPSPRGVHLRERYTQEWVDKLVGPEFPKEFQPFIEGTSSAYPKIFADAAGKNPTIRTIISPGTQPVVSTRDPRTTIAALEKLELYVVADIGRTADMNWADIVLPALTPYEIDHPFQIRGPMIMSRRKVVEPVGEGRSMQQIFLDLGVAMGYGKDFWDGDMEKCMNWQLEPLGLSMAELDKHPTGIIYEGKPRGFENYERLFGAKSPRLDKAAYLPQGKAAIYNTSFEAAGLPPLPRWVEPPESLTGTPELSSKYPLILSDYHTSISFSAGWQRNVPLLREVEPHPVLHIHPDAAGERGLKDGDDVRIESPHGHIRAKAELYPGIRPDTVMILHGWWQGCKELGLEDMPVLDGGANVNLLYEGREEKAYDPLITAMASQTLVQVSKIRPLAEATIRASYGN